jgi:c-di-GMP-binding flagellar brake protein YcgR
MASSTPKAASTQLDRRRRRHPRYRVDFRAMATYLEDSQYNKVEGHCSDLSEAGIGMLLPTDLNIGDVAGLSFSLPESSDVWESRAVVRYRRGYHYGFEFLSLTSAQRQALKSYLSGLKPESVD